MHKAWRDWYHCTVSTYGTWLPGDPRGWRERDHHEHVEGDYKRPPMPSVFAKKRHEYAKKLMRHEPYAFDEKHRETIGRLLVERFTELRTPLLSLAVCEKNFHALIQCRDGEVKRMLGIVKRHVTFCFAPVIDGMNRRRPIWEGEGGVKPIKNEAHARNAYQYILDHVEEGGWVWSYKDRLGC